MPTIVGILTFMNRINFVLSWVEHEKSFLYLDFFFDIVMQYFIKQQLWTSLDFLVN